jgi:hypothetical protein
MTPDEALALVRKGGSDRTRNKGQKPRRDEILAAEVERLRGELTERDRGAALLIAENAQLRQALRQAKAALRAGEPEQLQLFASR